MRRRSTLGGAFSWSTWIVFVASAGCRTESPEVIAPTQVESLLPSSLPSPLSPDLAKYLGKDAVLRIRESTTINTGALGFESVARMQETALTDKNRLAGYPIREALRTVSGVDASAVRAILTSLESYDARSRRCAAQSWVGIRFRDDKGAIVAELALNAPCDQLVVFVEPGTFRFATMNGHAAMQLRGWLDPDVRLSDVETIVQMAIGSHELVTYLFDANTGEPRYAPLALLGDAKLGPLRRVRYYGQRVRFFSFDESERAGRAALELVGVDLANGRARVEMSLAIEGVRAEFDFVRRDGAWRKVAEVVAEQ